MRGTKVWFIGSGIQGEEDKIHVSLDDDIPYMDGVSVSIHIKIPVGNFEESIEAINTKMHTLSEDLNQKKGWDKF